MLLLRNVTFLKAAFFGALATATVGVLSLSLLLAHYAADLPDFRHLADYEPPLASRIYAADGILIGEYAEQKRTFAPYNAIPPTVVNAFIAAEDQNFRTHSGVDYGGILRAAIANIERYRQGKRLQGGSTITQQVAKNFLLGNAPTFERKLKEMLLAFRMEKALSKERIMELYLNEIYLGGGTYGVSRAAYDYFGQDLQSLNVAQAAFLAALPKAPNDYNPRRHPQRARKRRDWVIHRMEEDGHIAADKAKAARATPLEVRESGRLELAADTNYFNEEVRRRLAERYGEDVLYRQGLAVRASLDSRLQTIAEESLREGLARFDRRSGWRGATARLDVGGDWARRLAALPPLAGLYDWRRTLVLEVNTSRAVLGFEDGGRGVLPFAAMRWARSAPLRPGGERGADITAVTDVLTVGDVVVVEKIEDGDAASAPQRYALRQLPEINGALVALNVHSGRIAAMSGGYSWQRNKFNRASQARRQTGSAFKPFVYLAALDNGWTPTTAILDAPLVKEQTDTAAAWKPTNYAEKFYGPTLLRIGLERSRNLMTLRLADAMGLAPVAAYAERLGIADNLPRNLTVALGTHETTLLSMVTAYAMFVNGGKRITPGYIQRIQDRYGRNLYVRDSRPCPGCRPQKWRETSRPPVFEDTREQVLDPGLAYQMVSLLEGAVKRGTGRSIATLQKPLAGKTGTTNDNKDAWFIGFSPDLAVGIYVGYDTPRVMGKWATGSAVAAPIFRDFMARALDGVDTPPFRIPAAIRLIRIHRFSGRPAEPGDDEKYVILEAFRAQQLEAAKGEKRPVGMEERLVKEERDVFGLY